MTLYISELSKWQNLNLLSFVLFQLPKYLYTIPLMLFNPWPTHILCSRFDQLWNLRDFDIKIQKVSYQQYIWDVHCQVLEVRVMQVSSNSTWEKTFQLAYRASVLLWCTYVPEIMNRGIPPLVKFPYDLYCVSVMVKPNKKKTTNSI
jgi:hypothetical protein